MKGLGNIFTLLILTMVIYLIGFIGCGKVPIGPKLARKLNMDFIDSDEWIENHQKMKISDIFNSSGEKVFELGKAALEVSKKLDNVNNFNRWRISLFLTLTLAK